MKEVVVTASSKEAQGLVHDKVTEEEIAKIISRWTGIPVTKLNESERPRCFIWTMKSIRD